MYSIRIVCSLTIIIGFTLGCVPGLNTRGLNPSLKQIDNFNIGVVQQKTVGEPMLVKEALVFYPGFALKTDFQPPSNLIVSSGLIPKGAKWECKWESENGDLLCYNPVYTYPYSAIIYLVVNKSWALSGYWSGGSVTKFDNPRNDLIEKLDVPQKDSFRQELIYNGRSKDTIKVSYREFKDDFARPAFQQDLSYDLSDSKEIGFRGAIIEVLEATNTYIKFIVRKPLSQ